MRRAHLCVRVCVCVCVCVLWYLSVNFPNRLFNSFDASLAVKRCGHTWLPYCIRAVYVHHKKQTDVQASPRPHCCQCSGFLTSALVVIHSITHRGCTIIKIKKKRMHKEKSLARRFWIFSWTLQQLSCLSGVKTCANSSVSVSPLCAKTSCQVWKNLNYNPRIKFFEFNAQHAL